MQSAIFVAAQKGLAVTRRFSRSEEGQDLLEYSLLVALIALFAIGAVTTVGNTIQTVFWSTIAASV
jgi:Flp pilus assembly pilin Flp